MIQRIRVETKQHSEMVEITREIEHAVQKEKVEEGFVLIQSLHTTAGITINENADPDVRHDMLLGFAETYPWEHAAYRHAEGNSAAHLKTSTVGHAQIVLIEKGRLVLGRWQGIYLCEFDGPRSRTVAVKVMADSKQK